MRDSLDYGSIGLQKWSHHTNSHSAGDAIATVPVFVSLAPFKDAHQYFVRSETFGIGGWAHSKECDYPEVAVRWMDFVRNSPEAQDLQDWGIEGVTLNVSGREKVPISTEDKPFSQKLESIGGRYQELPIFQSLTGYIVRWPNWLPEVLYPLDNILSVHSRRFPRRKTRTTPGRRSGRTRGRTPRRCRPSS